MSEGSTSALIPGLLGGRFNAAVVHLPVDDPELSIEPLFAEDLLLVTRSDHPLAEAGELSLSDVARHRLLLPPAGSALRRVLDRAARSVGVVLQAEAEIDGVRLLATLAVDGHGATIVPATAIPPFSAGRCGVVQVPELPPTGRRPRLPSPAAAERADACAVRRAP